MVEKVPGKTPPVTIEKIITLKKKNPVFIPTGIIENLKFTDREEQWAVMIGFHSCRELPPLWPFVESCFCIRILPTKSPKVLKLKIEFYSSNDFLEELGDVFRRNNIKTIYSTGICMHDPPCGPIEMYIDSDDLPISEEQLKSELQAVPSIVNVEITNVDVSNGDLGEEGI